MVKIFPPLFTNFFGQPEIIFDFHDFVTSENLEENGQTKHHFGFSAWNSSSVWEKLRPFLLHVEPGEDEGRVGLVSPTKGGRKERTGSMVIHLVGRGYVF